MEVEVEVEVEAGEGVGVGVEVEVEVKECARLVIREAMYNKSYAANVGREPV